MFQKCIISFYYLLHSEQYYSLLSQVFGKHLKAEQHVRGGHSVQGMGWQEHALKAILSHLREKIKSNIQSNLITSFCHSMKHLILKISNLCQSEVLWFDPHTPGDGFKDFSSAGVLLAHTHQKLTYTHTPKKCKCGSRGRYLYNFLYHYIVK